MRCSQCNNDLQENTNFGTYCGKKIKKTCTKCGKEIFEEDKFCIYCGNDSEEEKVHHHDEKEHDDHDEHEGAEMEVAQ